MPRQERRHKVRPLPVECAKQYSVEGVRYQILSLMATWYLTLEARRGKETTPAVTVPQIRDTIAMLLQTACQCDTPEKCARNKTRRLIRNEEARFYTLQNT